MPLLMLDQQAPHLKPFVEDMGPAVELDALEAKIKLLKDIFDFLRVLPPIGTHTAACRRHIPRRRVYDSPSDELRAVVAA